MNFWFVHSSDVSLVEQISTQVRMAVLAGDLCPGDRLPSVRALARRHGLHHNTVSQAYRRLEEKGVVESRHGSGVYVRPAAGASRENETRQTLAAMLAHVVKLARSMGTGDEELRAQFASALDVRRPTRVVLIEPDPELCAIVVAELSAQLDVAIEGCASAPEFHGPHSDAAIVALPSKADAVREAFPADAAFVALRIGSAAGSLGAHLPGPRGELLGLASRWPTFLEIGRTMLLAAGLDPEVLIVRDARDSGWQNGLEQAWGVVCDRVTAKALPPGPRPLIFRLVADDSLEELRTRLGAGL